MKKSLFIIGLALAALTVSCSKDVELQPAVGGKVTLGVAIESETRTALGALNGGKYDVVWSEGDCLAVNGTKSEPVDAAYVGKKTASFTISGVEAPYNVLYPASILGKDGNITVPTVQNYTEGSFAAGSAVAVGYTTGSAVTLKNLYSFVKLTIAKGDDVALKSVALQSVGGQAISGVYSVDYQNAEIRAIAGQSVIRIMDVPYGSDNKAVVYIAVPAGKYEGGFTVTVTGADGKYMTKKASKITDVPAGYLVNMPEFTYTGTARSEVVITSAAELVEFATVYNSGFDGVALLGNDIDMTGVEDLPYFSLLEGALFDGQGYAIKNWTSNHGLININYGTVKNLTIDQSCNLTFDMSNTDAHTPHAVVVAENLGVVSGCVNNANITVEAGDVTKNRYVGSIVGLLAVSNDGKVKNINARVENCINNGKIKLTLNSYTGGWFFAGGIVGTYYEYSTFGEGGLFNCVNNGNLEVNVGTMSNKNAVGGLIGGAGALEKAAAFCTIKDCVNNGAVTYNITTVNANSYIGGIAASCAAHVVNTTNNGDVTVTVPELGQIWFRTGGVVGDFAGNLTNVHNSGKVKVSLTTQAGKGATPQIGGVAAFHKGSTVAITNSTNSGEVNVATSLASNLFVGGILAQYSSKEVTMTGCENSGNITTVNTAYTSGTGSRVWTAGIVADESKATPTIEGCVNRGAISLSGDLNAESLVAGIAATNYCTFNNCKSLGDLHIENNYTEDSKYVVIAGLGARSSAAFTLEDCEVDCNITYYGTNVACGLIQGKIWGSNKTIISPVKIKKTTTINGVAVTEDDATMHTKLVAWDETTDGNISAGGWHNATEEGRVGSVFKINEGDVIIE
ncbi:MAG: hypothetical protein J6K33_00040 [Alistipes sp.]|nr:hypothetical protein [Alistipes sp.]